MFDLRHEFTVVVKIGEILHESGQYENYKNIKEFLRYGFNEEETALDPGKIYEYLKDKGIDDDLTNSSKLQLLYNQTDLKNNLISHSSLKIMGNYSFFSEEEKEKFSKQKNAQSSVFSYSYTVDEWAVYRLLDFGRGRFFVSFFEFVYLMHHGKLMRNLIKSRYNPTNKTVGKLYKFRDGIDMEKELNSTKKLIKESLKNEREKWLSTYDNSFNYLLNIVGHVGKEHKKKSGYKIKSFNTLLGSYVNFKSDMLLFEQNLTVNPTSNGSIPEIYFESNVKFYEEIKAILGVFKGKMTAFVSVLESEESKRKLLGEINDELDCLFGAVGKIIEALKLRENNTKNSTYENITKSAFYFDNKTKDYQGWFADLYRNKTTNKLSYNLKLFIHNFFVAKPIIQANFGGCLVYAAMNYPEFGLISVPDYVEKRNKIMLYNIYSGNEYPHGYVKEIDFNGLRRIILSRK